MSETIYKGFSTNGADRIDTALFGIQLVRQDILNQFSTPLRVRVRRGRSYGTIIYSLFMDLFDSRTEGIVSTDVQRIVASDPRVSLVGLNIQMDDTSQSITVGMLLHYVEFNITDTNWINFVFSGKN